MPITSWPNAWQDHQKPSQTSLIHCSAPINPAQKKICKTCKTSPKTMMAAMISDHGISVTTVKSSRKSCLTSHQKTSVLTCHSARFLVDALRILKSCLTSALKKTMPTRNGTPMCKALTSFIKIAAISLGRSMRISIHVQVKSLAHGKHVTAIKACSAARSSAPSLPLFVTLPNLQQTAHRF